MSHYETRPSRPPAGGGEPERPSGRHVGGRGHTRLGGFSLQAFADAYQPRREPRWPEIEGFVRRCVAASGAASYSRANRITRAVTFLALYCLRSGIQLEEEAAFHPDRIDHFAATWAGKQESIKDYRAELRVLGEKITVAAPYRAKVPLHRNPVPAPYTGLEVEALLWAVRTQATETRRQAGEAVLALGLGAGLDGRWFARIQPRDLRLTSAGQLVVAVPSPSPRRVPVDPPWDVRLHELAELSTTECLVGRASTATNRAFQLIDAIDLPSTAPRLNARRLRSTWLVNQVIAGIPLPHLLDAAGLEALNQLARLLPYAAELIGAPAWASDAPAEMSMSMSTSMKGTNP